MKAVFASGAGTAFVLWEVRMVHVYVLQSKSSGRIYIGHTADIERRLHEHQSGQSRSTRERGPWVLVGQCLFDSRAEAMQKERELMAMKNPKRVLAEVATWS